jgi:polysaccharide pyruvyl transferase WcaK-like protein
MEKHNIVYKLVLQNKIKQNSKSDQACKSNYQLIKKIQEQKTMLNGLQETKSKLQSLKNVVVLGGSFFKEIS